MIALCQKTKQTCGSYWEPLPVFKAPRGDDPKQNTGTSMLPIRNTLFLIRNWMQEHFMRPIGNTCLHKGGGVMRGLQTDHMSWGPLRTLEKKNARGRDNIQRTDIATLWLIWSRGQSQWKLYLMVWQPYRSQKHRKIAKSCPEHITRMSRCQVVLLIDVSSNVSLKCLIKRSHKNVSSNCLIEISHQIVSSNVYKMANQNVS